MEPTPVPRSVDAIDWQRWQPVDQGTLLFVVRRGRVLLIHKKRGLGAGKINGPGGRLDDGESPLECAMREVEEEVRVTPSPPRPAGELLFQFLDGYSIHVHVFRSDDLRGTPTETDEALPFWSDIDSIPYESMWPDDEIWLPLMLAERPFRGHFIFDREAMLDFRVEDLEGGTIAARTTLPTG